MHGDPKTFSRLRPFHAPGPWNAYGSTSTRIYFMARDDMRGSGKRFFGLMKFGRYPALGSNR
ncbi:hypothetical protein BHYA_0257g00050 [Botrytis hyacinthi]|uniref:Uncharacterized protein n=1 Tax=Botrytis hyacinthi TaxID=278943 RepID=A0A4Z1GCR6_9HELO|nr:hypothetical protein BHYA_0257g00050 [Botrytis hyacinthi]